MIRKLKFKNFQGLEPIRHMYYIEEKSIKNFTRNAGIWLLNYACMVATKKIRNKRYEIKYLIEELKKNFKDVDKSNFKSAKNVNMESILGWEKDGQKHSFLDFYDE